MPNKKFDNSARTLTFMFEGMAFFTLQTALQQAAMSSLLEMDGKHRSILVFPKSVDAARHYGGEEAVEAYRKIRPGEPLAQIQVKAESHYWRG